MLSACCLNRRRRPERQRPRRDRARNDGAVGCIEPNVKRAWPLVLATVLVAAGCGGDREAARQREPTTTAELQHADPSLRLGWRTNFAKARVPLGEFQPGGPGKDGIPALTQPHFAPVAEISFLKPREPV